MKNPVELLLQQTGLSNSYFQPTSRYYGMETMTIDIGKFKKVAFVSRRFISQPDEFELLREHNVEQNDRPDNIAHQYLGDPEQYWRICDANAVLHPNELTAEIGDYIRITLPDTISSKQ